MKIRNLITNDIFKMSKILKKMGLKIDTKGKSKEQLGTEIITSVFENLYLAQDEVNDFLGGLVGITGKEFGQLEVEQSIDIISQFKDINGISSFFKAAGTLTK